MGSLKWPLLIIVLFMWLEEAPVEEPYTQCDRYVDGYYDGACPYDTECPYIVPMCEENQDRGHWNSYNHGKQDGTQDRIDNTLMEDKDVQEKSSP
jgi:hypothetical protein